MSSEAALQALFEAFTNDDWLAQELVIARIILEADQPLGLRIQELQKVRDVVELNRPDDP